MGQRVMILVVLVMIIIGYVVINLEKKNKQSSDELTELTYQQQASQLANTYATLGLKELNEQIATGIEPATNVLIETSNLLNHNDSSARVTFVTDTFEGNTLESGDYMIVSVATLKAPDGNTYIAEVNALYGDERPLSGGGGGDEEPLVLDLRNLPAGALWIRIQADGITMNVANNNSGKNMHQFPSQLNMNPFLHVPLEDIIAAGNVVICPEIPSGIVQVSGHNNMMEPPQPNWKIPYPFTLFIENNDVKIDGPLLSDHEINIVSKGKISYSSVDKSPDPILISDNTHYWAESTITVPASKPATKGLLEPNKHPNADSLTAERFIVPHDTDIDTTKITTPPTPPPPPPPVVKNWSEKPVRIVRT
jgi:hypothetical protein